MRFRTRNWRLAAILASLLFPLVGPDWTIVPRATTTCCGQATASPTNRAPEVWRDASHGGRNCLLLLLYVHGNVTDYDKYLELIDQHPPPQTAAELLAVAEAVGFPMQARSLSAEALDKVPLPVVVHVDGDNPREGAFHVLLGRDSARVAYLNGPAATISSQNKELFLRRWSGVVLMPRPKRSLIALPTLIAFSMVLACALLGTRVRHVFRRGCTAAQRSVNSGDA